MSVDPVPLNHCERGPERIPPKIAAEQSHRSAQLSYSEEREQGAHGAQADEEGQESQAGPA